MRNRWVVLAASVVTQTILGGIYAWSTFVPALIEKYGLNNAGSSFIFGLTIAVFTVSMTFAGRLLKQKGPRLTANISALLYMTGYLIASLSGGGYLLLLISLGLITGAGIGFGYVGPLSVGMKWFPDRKGLITGVAVAGFGGGAVILSTVAGVFIDSGLDVLVFFRWMGVLLGTVLLIAAQCMSEPLSDGQQKKSADVNIKRELISPQFLLITAGLFSGTFAGLLVIGNLVPIVRASGLSAGEAVAAVSIFAAGNAAGRITWGHIFDRFGLSSIPASLVLLGACIAALFLNIPAWSILIIIGLIGFGFGGCFVIYASAVSRYFGVEAFPILYPLSFLGYGAAGIIGPVIGGGLADATGSFTSALAVSVLVLVSAGALTFRGLKFFRVKGESKIAWSSEL